MPSEKMERARLLEWCFFVMTELDATSMYVIRRHQGLKDIYGEAPVAVESAKTYFSKQLGCVSDVLSKTQPYLMGGQFSVADILLTTCLTGMLENKILFPDICVEYLDRMTSRKAYREAFEVNHPETRASSDVSESPGISA